MKSSVLVLLGLASLLSGTHAHAALYQWSALDGAPNRRCYLWIPEECARLRGVVLVMKNMTETGLTDDPAVREACRHQRVGILWVSEDRTARGFARSAFNSDWGWPSGLSPADEKEYYRLRDALKKGGLTDAERQAAEARLDAWDQQLIAEAGPALDHILKLMAAESGYEELTRAPVLFLSHSMGGLLCWHAPYRIPERCWGAIPFKTGVRTQPKDLPGANCHGVPIMYVNQIAAVGPGGHADPNDNCLPARADTDNIVCQLYDWGGHHLDTTPELARMVALFIEKAGRYRLSDEIPATGLPKLKDLKAGDGWLATSINEPQQFAAAPADQYAGPRHRAFWFFDQEMAQAVTGFEREHQRRKPQFVTATSNGQPLVPLSAPFESINVPVDTGVDDGWTFKLRATLLDTDPIKQVAAGHAATGAPHVELTGGCNWVKLDDETFRYRQFNRGPHGHGYVIAWHPGDADYARACTPLNIWMPDFSRKGVPQTITFPEPTNVPVGTREIGLKATSSVPGQTVEYYVVSGPAELVSGGPKFTGSVLRFTQIPPRAKFPVKVIVVAYQKGRLKEPFVQTAPEVAREFAIVRPGLPPKN